MFVFFKENESSFFFFSFFLVSFSFFLPLSSYDEATVCRARSRLLGGGALPAPTWGKAPEEGRKKLEGERRGKQRRRHGQAGEQPVQGAGSSSVKGMNEPFSLGLTHSKSV